MTDRKLLELAAKAAVLNFFVGIDWHDKDKPYVGDRYKPVEWNPLTGDGDALRLAVQLSLEIYFEGEDKESSVAVGYPVSIERPCKIEYAIEFHEGDIFKATRRAIVRAAAEIGRSMP